MPEMLMEVGINRERSESLVVVQFENPQDYESDRACGKLGAWQKPTFQRVGDLVRSSELTGIFKVIGIQVKGEKCFIQEFDISKQRFADESQPLVPCSTLSPFEEDASQAAARIVREATENR